MALDCLGRNEKWIENTLTGDNSDDVNYVRTEMAQRSSAGPKDFDTNLLIKNHFKSCKHHNGNNSGQEQFPNLVINYLKLFFNLTET